MQPQRCSTWPPWTNLVSSTRSHPHRRLSKGSLWLQTVFHQVLACDEMLHVGRIGRTSSRFEARRLQPGFLRGWMGSTPASDIGFCVCFGPSSETPRNPESTAKGILLQSDIAVTAVLTHFSRQSSADSSPCSRKINLVHLTLRQGAGNRSICQDGSSRLSSVANCSSKPSGQRVG
jgi:hypothetical protein